MRRIFAEISVDEKFSDKHNKGPIDYLESEFGWLEESGILLTKAVIADEDEEDKRVAYAIYLMELAMKQSLSGSPTKSPLTFEDWRMQRKRYPELDMYEDSQYDMTREPDDTPGNELGRYEIVFEADGKRYYCYADAADENEALGQFFRSHPHITYEMVIDHFEI